MSDLYVYSYKFILFIFLFNDSLDVRFHNYLLCNCLDRPFGVPVGHGVGGVPGVGSSLCLSDSEFFKQVITEV